VQKISILYNRGLGPDEIQAEFAHIPLERIYAALAYYLANRAAIDARVEADDRYGDEMAAKYPNGITREDVLRENAQRVADESS